MAERDARPRLHMKKVDVLLAVPPAWIRVIEDPLVSGQVGAVSIAHHRAFSNMFDMLFVPAAVGKQKEARAATGKGCPAQNMTWIAPDEMRHPAVVIDDTDVLRREVRGKHPRLEPALSPAPAMQKKALLQPAVFYSPPARLCVR